MSGGWGGARVGAGKKPKPKTKPLPISPFAIMPGGRIADDPPIDRTHAEPPADLPVEQQPFWRVAALLAIERGTLVEATVPAFRMLCELEAKKIVVGDLIDKGALGGLRIYLQLCKQVEGLMGRFCLAPFGKPIKAEKPKQKSNPWAQVMTK